MTQKKISVSISQHSQAGIGKLVNQDALIAYVPDDSLLQSKGAVFAVADGISTSQFGAEASQIAVSSFLNDYLDTPETWSVKTSGFKVLLSINSWLVAQSRQGGHSFNQNKGYVCAFATLIIKSRTIHIFHSGDVRVVMLHKGIINILTQDHRQVYDDERTYLSAALGLDDHIRLDYLNVEAQLDATYLLLSDGVHEYLNNDDIIQTLEKLPSATCAQILCELATTKGSVDDASALVIKINDLPAEDRSEFYRYTKDLTPIISLEKGAVIDGLHVVRPLSKTPRSHTYLVIDQNESLYVLKTPSAEKSQDDTHIESMLMEEWVARRLNNAN
jgi:serine/threonine protein phosphatase PrpC